MKPIRFLLGLGASVLILGIAWPAHAAPAPSFSIDNATTDEELGQLCFVVRKHGTLNSSPSSVTFQTAPGTALAGSDYVTQSFVMTYGPNELRRNACVPLINNATPEPTETFTGKLVKGSNSRLYDGTAIGTITDNDKVPPTPIVPVVSVDSVTVSEDAGVAVVHVRRSSAEGSTSFSYATADQTAASGTNYTGSSGSAGFGPGGADAAFSIPILRDNKITGDLAFGFVLKSITNGTKGTDGMVTIRDVDVAPPPPRIVTCQDVSVREDAGTATINCSATTNGADAVIDIAAIGSPSNSMPTATAGLDYQSYKVRYTITATATAFSFPILIVNDTLVEGTESFGASIIGVTNATSGHDPQISIADDDVAPLPPAAGLFRIKACPANVVGIGNELPAPLWGHNLEGVVEIAKVGQLVKKIEHADGLVYRPGDFVNIVHAFAVQAVDSAGAPIDAPGSFYVFGECLEPAS